MAELVARERELRWLQAEQGAILAEMTSRGSRQAYGYADVVGIQVDVLRIDRAEARRRLARAAVCFDTTEAGRVRPAAAPQTAEAWAAGDISSSHVDAIVGVVDALPGTVPAGKAAAYEELLVQRAQENSPRIIGRFGRRILAGEDPDGVPPRADDPVAPQRELAWAWRRDNTLQLKGRLDRECGLLLETLLSPLAKPRPQDDGTPDTRSVWQRHGDAFAELLDVTQRCADLGVEAGETPALTVTIPLAQLQAATNTQTTSNVPTTDVRAVAAQAAADVMAAADAGGVAVRMAGAPGNAHAINNAGGADGAVDSKRVTTDAIGHGAVTASRNAAGSDGAGPPIGGPGAGGVRAALVAGSVGGGPGVAGAETVSTVGSARAVTTAGVGLVPTLNEESPISVEQARRLACAARVIPAVLGSAGEVLDLGREVRTVTRAQRRALALRDRGCAFAGCDRPVAWTQAHHIHHWCDGGPSDLDNLVLLCGPHHRLIHHSDWDIRISHDGMPECLPPTWIDTQRNPRRNTAHHPGSVAAA